MPSSQVRQVGAGAAALTLVVLLVLAFMFGYDAVDRHGGWRHSVAAGKRQPGDIVLWSVILNKPSNENVYEDTYCYPNSGSRIHGNITAYSLTNLMPSDIGGYVQVTSGGLNMTKLCFNLTNQENHGYIFNTTLWGKPV